MRSPELAGVAAASAVSLAVVLGGGFEPSARVLLGVLLAVVSAGLCLGLRGLPLHTPAEEEFAAQHDQLLQQLLREKQNRAIQEWMTTQRENAEIDDYRQVLISM